MAYSIMEALFDGRIIPWERHNPKSKEQLEILNQLEDEERYFIQKMSLDDCNRFQKLSNLHGELAYSDDVDTYSHGFTLGALLMMEVMAKKEEIIRE